MFASGHNGTVYNVLVTRLVYPVQEQKEAWGTQRPEELKKALSGLKPAELLAD